MTQICSILHPKYYAIVDEYEKISKVRKILIFWKKYKKIKTFQGYSIYKF